jgi:predicted ATPase
MNLSTDRRFLTRVRLRNYKSIGACDVELAQLAFLVGPNGSGKSNFLDALRFVSESLGFSLDHALRDRGGISEVRRRSGGHPTHFGVRLDFRLPESEGHYAFTVGAQPKGGYVVQREEASTTSLKASGERASFVVEDGRLVEATVSTLPAPTSDRLLLVTASGLSQFRPMYDALSGMAFHNLNPEAIRQLQPADPGDRLRHDGGNLAAVVARLEAASPELKKRLEEYLARVVTGVSGVSAIQVGHMSTLRFMQQVSGAKNPWNFVAHSMSDGTLRALGVLASLFLPPNGSSPRLVGIEEPEVALHPAAAGILTDALRDASERVQVLVTSHSPDLLDDGSIPHESILAVVSEHGDTRIGPLDEAGRSILHEHLYTAGELLRMDQLRPDPALSQPRQLELFDKSP